MTINQQLTKAMKESSKVCLFVEAHPFPYDDAIIKKVTRSEITFVAPLTDRSKHYLVEYILNKNLIVGIGSPIASVVRDAEDVEECWDDYDDDY